MQCQLSGALLSCRCEHTSSFCCFCSGWSGSFPATAFADSLSWHLHVTFVVFTLYGRSDLKCGKAQDLWEKKKNPKTSGHVKWHLYANKDWGTLLIPRHLWTDAHYALQEACWQKSSWDRYNRAGCYIVKSDSRYTVTTFRVWILAHVFFFCVVCVFMRVFSKCSGFLPHLASDTGAIKWLHTSLN